MADLAQLEGAIRATEEWIGDLQQRLGWQDRDRVSLPSLRPCTRCAMPCHTMRLRMLAATCRLCCVGCTTMAGIHRGGARHEAAVHSLNGSRMACTAIPASMPSRSRAPFLRCWRRAFLQESLRMPRPRRPERCTISGRIDFGHDGSTCRPQRSLAGGRRNPDLSVRGRHAGSGHRSGAPASVRS